MTRSHLSFHTERPTRRVDVKSFPARRVEWRRMVAAESLVPSRPLIVEIHASSSSCAEPTVYGSGITWSTTVQPSTFRVVPAGARM